jgi:hypothetical protein
MKSEKIKALFAQFENTSAEDIKKVERKLKKEGKNIPFSIKKD